MRRLARSALDRLPPYATLGVGSLPGADPVIAVRHVMTAYDVPFCPQLPSLDGDMIEEWLGVGWGRCGWSPERDRALPRAWGAFLDAVIAQPPPHGVVKLQVTGPVTLCWALEARNSSPAAILAHDVATWLADNVRPRISILAELGLDCLLVIDEPALGFVPVHETLRKAWEPLRTVSAAWGFHVCCPPPWQLLEDMSPDFLNVDVVNHPIDDSAAGSVHRLVQGGTTMAWGITPTTGAGGRAAAAEVLGRVTARLACCEMGPDQMARQTALTPSCGTGANSMREELAVSLTLGGIAVGQPETARSRSHGWLRPPRADVQLDRRV